ncbi:hypothetical protein F5883DRAFT_656188 [Diaporthe sp. PMI_573]|nr:hypothetical protein F5883DRAFT_656188 [Diaporthaceae sp. PMI_573]
MDTTEALDFLVGVAVVALWSFMGTMIGFDIYNLVPAFNWIFDFVLIEGTGSSNLKWAVAVVIFTFLRLVLTFLVFADMFGVFGDDDSCWQDDENEIMLLLSVISVLYLGLTLPPWVAVLRRGWGDVLRAAGHGLDAGRADIYWRFGIAVVVFWGLILATCIVLFLASGLLVNAWK